ncbi:hypothetical protein Q0590_32710 [Rhodocytophaga aerolata]|uniref:Uncharacterized protein n=1 Tax=Rhodocytophaga aerolata TaxID=455078 RepID=A0ABT8RG51_9BACT|nr:hypothetical protein [Rhodocytophaga aerolata]MDO1451082.1 hypothetical protein [Rhodocytophaga aerolata]
MSHELYLIMSIYIKITKSSLTGQDALSAQLAELSTQVKELPDACLYKPKAGSLWKFIQLVHEENVPLEIISELEEDLPIKDLDKKQIDLAKKNRNEDPTQ